MLLWITSQAPVVSLFNANGNNRLTFAFSDGLNPVLLKACIIEETAEYNCSIKMFTEPSTRITEYQSVLCIDTRNIPYYESLNNISEWWASFPEYTPAEVPDFARLPMYSTWYSFHQKLIQEKIETQCRIAKAIGCESIIVDDG